MKQRKNDAITTEDVLLNLCQPDELPGSWVGQKELVRQIMAAWLLVGSGDYPLNPGLIGKPGG